jgi:uncharacterized protein YjdB
LQLTATVTPSDYDTEYYSVVFSSGTTNKATVNAATGLVTGVAEAAEVVITAEFKYLDGETWTSFDPAIKDTLALEVTAGD